MNQSTQVLYSAEIVDIYQLLKQSASFKVHGFYGNENFLLR